MAATPTDPESSKPLKPIVFDILVILAQGDRHGWSIVKALEDGPGQWRNILPGNLYRTLRDMKEKGFIEESDARPDPAEDDERRRYYRLSNLGRAVAVAEARRLERTLRAADAVDLLPAEGPSNLAE
jgi:DNA-binding PadR family transcriptional regulator